MKLSEKLLKRFNLKWRNPHRNQMAFWTSLSLQHLLSQCLSQKLQHPPQLFKNLKLKSTPKSPLSNSLVISRKKIKVTGESSKKPHQHTNSKPLKPKFCVNVSSKLKAKDLKPRKTTTNSKSSVQSSTSKTTQSSKANTLSRSKTPKKASTTSSASMERVTK